MRQRGTLYVGTTQGLFALRHDTAARFVRHEGLQGGCGDLLSFGGRLIAATSQELLEVGGAKTTTLLPFPAWTLAI